MEPRDHTSGFQKFLCGFRVSWRELSKWIKLKLLVLLVFKLTMNENKTKKKKKRKRRKRRRKGILKNGLASRMVMCAPCPVDPPVLWLSYYDP